MNLRYLRILALAIIIGLIIAAGSVVFFPVSSAELFYIGDFPGFLVLGEIIKQGQVLDLYSIPLQQKIQQELFPTLAGSFNPSLYPVWTAYLLYPLSFLSPGTAKLFFCLLNAGCFAAAFHLLIPRQSNRWLLFPIMLVCIPVFVAIIGAQNSAITLLLLAIIYRQLQRKNIRSDLVASLCCTVLFFKPQFGIIALFLFFAASRSWLFLAATVLGITTVTFSFIGAFGIDFFTNYLHVLATFDTINLQVNQAEVVSLRGILEVLVSSMDYTPNLVLIAQRIGSGASVLLTLFFCILLWRKKLSFQSVFLLLPFISPQTLFYDLTIVFGALMLTPISINEKAKTFSALAVLGFFCLWLREIHMPIPFVPLYVAMIFFATRQPQTTSH